MSGRSTEQKDKPTRLFSLGVVVAGIASVAWLSVMLIKAIEKVQSGHGLDTYRTFWLVEFNWVGFLVFCAASIVALLVGLGFRVNEFRQIRSLQRKYGEKKGDA